MNTVIQNAQIVSIVSDGWSNLRNDHLVNFIVVVPLKKPILYKVIDTSGVSQTGQTIYEDLKKIIDEIGLERVSSVVTDNAANMRAAWKQIEANYPTIFVNGCGTHVLNLLIKDILEINEYKKTLQEAVDITKFIKSHGALAKEFRTIQASLSCKRFLSLPVKTRGYTQYHCVKNVLDNRETLTLICLQTALVKKYSGLDDFAQFIAHVRDDDFWIRLENLANILKPVCDGIGLMEKDNCVASDIYRLFLSLLAEPVFKKNQAILELINERWNFLHTESMGFAYLLDPRTLGGKGMVGTDKQNTVQELKAYLKKTNSDDDAFDIDAEVSSFIQYWCYLSDTDKEKSKVTPPLETWSVLLSEEFPRLYRLAIRLFSMPTSLAASERVWSVFSFIQSKKRGKLLNDKVMKLAKVYVNTSISKMENAKKKKMIAMDYFKEDNIGLEEEEDDEETDIIEK